MVVLTVQKKDEIEKATKGLEPNITADDAKAEFRWVHYHLMRFQMNVAWSTKASGGRRLRPSPRSMRR